MFEIHSSKVMKDNNTSQIIMVLNQGRRFIVTRELHPTNTEITSLIAESLFSKSYDKILRDIRKLSYSQEFDIANFGETYYVNDQNKEQSMYFIIKGGFSFFVLG